MAQSCETKYINFNRIRNNNPVLKQLLNLKQKPNKSATKRPPQSDVSVPLRPIKICYD